QSEATYDTTNGAVFNYTVGYIYSGSGTPTVGVVKANTTFVTTYP
ncbi:type 1 fimbrial protein, partial [Citrobacter freundii]